MIQLTESEAQSIAAAEGCDLRPPKQRKTALRRIEWEGRSFVCKDASHLRGPWGLLLRRLLRREARVYERLAGLPGLPVCHGLVGGNRLLLDAIDGDVLRRESMPLQCEDYFERLRQVISGIHARGYCHLDLGHRSNLLVGPRGHPFVVDFASAVRVSQWPLLGTLGTRVDFHKLRGLERRYSAAATRTGIGQASQRQP